MNCFCLVCNIIMIILAIINLVLTARNATKYAEKIRQNFVCEAMPIPERACIRGYRQYFRPFMVKATILLMEVVPALNLMFVIDTKVLRQVLRNVIKCDKM